MNRKLCLEDFLRSHSVRLKIAMGKNFNEPTGWRLDRWKELYAKVHNTSVTGSLLVL